MVVLPSADELIACWKKCVELREAIKERQAGGKDNTSGRLRKHDSARLRCLDRVVEPQLRMGILPASYDAKILFEYEGPNTIAGPAKLEVDEWAKTHYVHPRSKEAAAARASAAMPMEDQRTLLDWIRIDAPASVSQGSVRAPGGRPKVAFVVGKLLPQSQWKDYTIPQLKRESRASRRFYEWLCSARFVRASVRAA